MKNKKTAISGVKSLIKQTTNKSFKTKWDCLVQERRTFVPGVPQSPFDGGGCPGAFSIGWDVEYVRQDAKTNRILSYQFCALLPDGCYVSGIHYCENGRRIRFSHLVGSAVEVCVSEGLLSRWPRIVFLCAHYSLADLPCFEDQHVLFPIVDNVRKTFVSIKHDISITYYDRNRHPHNIRVALRDSKLLTPAGKGSLKEIGELLDFPKITLSEDQISNMDKLLEQQPKLFQDYAMRDAEITVHYCDQMRRLNLNLNGHNRIPTTLSSIGVTRIFRLWKELGINSNDVLGLMEIEEIVLLKGHPVKRKRNVPRDIVELHNSLAIHCFHGGRNEQYFFGASPEGLYTDYDLTGAYTTAMSLFGMPLWEEIFCSCDVDMFQPDTLGYARVYFEFPHDTRFPCLPVRSQAGLIFPLKGISFCCAPEIYLASRMGASIQIEYGIIVPQCLDIRPFAEFILEMTHRRKEHVKGSLFELFWKELANGVYGKTAQGTRKRNCYNPRSDSYEELPPSKITNAYFAAWVTSFIRAVLGEILASLPPTVLVSNVTTDGLLTDATPDQMGNCKSGPLCTLFQKGRYAITGKHECLEIKHRAKQILGVRTRGQFTLLGMEGEKPILAKMGIKPPCKTDTEANEWCITAFVERTPETFIKVPALRPLPEICREGGDLVNNLLTRRLRMDFDWKRKVDMASVCSSHVRHVNHLFFRTLPWDTVGDCLAHRKNWEDFSRQGRVLKTEEDLHDFHDYKSVRGLPSGIRRSKKKPVEKIVKRQFLRAYVRSLAGLKSKEYTYREAANILSDLGLPARKSDFENAARSRSIFIPNVLPRSSKILKLLALLKREFPTFEPELLLEPATNRKTIRENAAHPSVPQHISLPDSHTGSLSDLSSKEDVS